MLILAIDTAAAACTACLWRDGVVLAERQEVMARGQDARLLPLILALLDEKKLGFNNLDRIAVTRGPGSFTGIRIGLAAARGIGFAAGKPVLGFDRFSLFRHGLQTPLPLLTVIDSKRDELFYQFAATTPAMATIDDIATKFSSQAIALTGDNQQQLQSLQARLPQAQLLTLPQSEAALAATLAAQINAEDFPAYAPRPLYLRAPDVSFGPTPPTESQPEQCR